MKKTLLALACCALFAACSKKDDTPAPVTNPGTGTGTGTNTGNTNPYYFRFKLDGQAYNLVASQPQYISSYENHAGGYMQLGNLVHPSMMLRFAYDKPVTDAMMKGLAGKTFYFDGSDPTVELAYDSTLSQSTRYSVDTTNHGFFVKVNSITYLKKDTTIFNPVAVYVINGTCKAVLENYDKKKLQLATDGEFNFLVSRVDK